MIVGRMVRDVLPLSSRKQYRPSPSLIRSISLDGSRPKSSMPLIWICRLPSFTTTALSLRCMYRGCFILVVSNGLSVLDGEALPRAAAGATYGGGAANGALLRCRATAERIFYQT